MLGLGLVEVHPTVHIQSENAVKGSGFSDGVLLLNKESCCRVLVTNQSESAVTLHPHETVGLVADCLIIDDDDDSDENENKGVSMPDIVDSGSLIIHHTKAKQESDENRKRLSGMLDISTSAVPLQQMKDIIQWLLTHHDIFALDEYDLGQTEITKHEICTGNHPPIC